MDDRARDAWLLDTVEPRTTWDQATRRRFLASTVAATGSLFMRGAVLPVEGPRAKQRQLIVSSIVSRCAVASRDKSSPLTILTLPRA
jgi:hypothetical protein